MRRPRGLITPPLEVHVVSLEVRAAPLEVCVSPLEVPSCCPSRSYCGFPLGPCSAPRGPSGSPRSPFFIFIAAPEGHTVVHFGEEIISIMSGTYYIDYSSSVLARTAQLLLTCSAALNVLSCSQRRRGWYESFFITEHRLVNINQPKEGIVRTNRTKTMSTWSWQKSPKHKMLGHWLTQNQPGKLPCRWLFWSGATFILRWYCSILLS